MLRADIQPVLLDEITVFPRLVSVLLKLLSEF